jgi:hypothetical protein
VAGIVGVALWRRRGKEPGKSRALLVTQAGVLPL